MIKHKVLFIFSVFFFAMLLDACDDNGLGVDCNCPAVDPFFDFDYLGFLNYDLEIDSTEFFEFEISPTGLEFFANVCKKNHFSFSLMPELMACSCIGNGFEGMKFPIESLTLTSNANWSEELVAGEDLSDLLFVNLNGNLESTNTFLGDPFLLTVYTTTLLQISDRPSGDNEHVLTLVLNKTNGESVVLELPKVTWE